MKNIKKVGLMLITIVISISIFVGCDVPEQPVTVKDTLEKSNLSIAENQKRLETTQPAPKLSYSLERQNQIDRTKIINDKNRLGYLYLLSDDGKVVDFVVIKGKVSSTKSYLVPDETLANANISDSAVIQAPDIDGSYGENQEAIYFFEADGQMGEWNGKYRYSTKPLKITTSVVLVQEKK